VEWPIPRQAVPADVRIHDLRHSFASGAVMAGDGLLLVGKMLGTRRPLQPRNPLILLTIRYTRQWIGTRAGSRRLYATIRRGLSH